MGYRLVPVKRVHSKAQFKIRFEWFEDGKRLTKSLPKQQWASVGFNEAMTLEDAKERIKQLNSLEALKRVEQSRAKVLVRQSKEKLIQSSYLPEALITEFEQKLFGRLTTPKKINAHWTVTKRIIFDMKIEPSDWQDNKEKFYDYFSEKQYSISYITTLIPMLNKWGYFISKKNGKFFEPLECPKGIERERIADANLEKTSRTGNKTSEPLTPSLLEKKKANLLPEHYNWLYLTVWFGLRPSEVDLLLKETSKHTWSIKNWKTYKVLSIYQAKLVKIARDKRFKSIPCVTKEQLAGLDIITSKQFKRPLSKTIKNHFGEDYSCYAGRKGFVSLMIGFGHSLEKISRWLGHQSIERTWTSYTNKNEDLV